MNQIQNSDQFDLEDLRKKISEVSTRPADAPSGSETSETATINPLARRIAHQFRDGNYSPTLIIGQLRLLEFVALISIALGTRLIAASSLPPLSLSIVAAILGGCALAVLILQLVDSYQIPSLRQPMRMAPRILASFAISFSATVLAIVLIEPRAEISTVWFVAWGLGGCGFLLLERVAVAFGIRHWARNGIMERRAVIVGGGQPAKDLIRMLEAQPGNDIRICGIFDDRNDDRSPTVVAGYPKLGTVAELVEFARIARIDMLIIALPLSAEKRILQLLRKLWILPVDIRLAAHANKLRFRPRSYSGCGAVPMLDIFDKPIRDWDSVAKRIFDIFFSVLAILVLWPVMIGVAIAVKTTSKGPILFKQKRHGFNNETINVMKFRSMYTEMSDPTAKLAVTKNDPRVTPVGRFLRKSSLDELPQFFNVLRGELSLVGPRPHAVQAQTHDRRYGDVVEGYFARHRVKPGVTGWAQINGWRGEIDSDDKIKFRTAYDLYYIENWSLLLDLKILFLTPLRIINTDNAY